MTARVERPEEWTVLDDHQRRIRALESIVPGEGGTISYCTGCYDVDPDLAYCIDLAPGQAIPISAHTVLQGTLFPSGFSESETACGNYRCNWDAGFRLQVRYVGIYDGLQTHLVGGVSRVFNTYPGSSDWTSMPTPVVGYGSPTDIDTGWVTITFDPSGFGNEDDPWWVWFGADDTSILFDATVGAGTFYFRWVNVADLANQVPQALAEGQILVSVDNGAGAFEWQLLDPGTVGQVLTISAGGVPEWA